MNYSDSKIVLVDDDSNHLDLLSQCFFKNGIPCVPVLYDAFEEPPVIDNIRLLFSDINLTNSGSETNMLTVVIEYLNKILGYTKGPYVLIFWTNKTETITIIKKIVNERFRDMVAPFVVDCIDKDQIIGFTDQDSRLKNRLTEVLGCDSIQFLFDFKHAVSYAGDDVINSLYTKIRKPGLSWGEAGDFEPDFRRTFSKIAGTHFGLQHALKNPQKAIMDALMPLVHHRMINYSGQGCDYSRIMGDLKGISNIGKLDYPEHFNQSVLNATFHIDEVAQPVSIGEKEKRGCVIRYKNKKESRTRYCRNNLGITYNDLFEACFPYKYKETDNKHKADLKKYNSEVRDKSDLVFIEISAACDYSQDKKRVNPYVVGIKTPVSDLYALKKSDSILPLPVFSYKGEKFRINVCCNYVVGLLPSSSVLGEVLFCLKDHLVSYIGNCYANHISRIGISEFK